MSYKHKSLAVEGVGFGFKSIAVLGTRLFDIEIIPPQIINSGGGIIEHIPPRLVFRIKHNGKLVVKQYNLSQSQYSNIQLFVKYIIPLKLSVKNIVKSIVNVIPSASFKKAEQNELKITVEKKKLDFIIRRKK